MDEKKTCRICGQIKLQEEFEIDSRKKSVYTSRCKACKYSLDDKAQRAYRSLKRRSAKLNIPMDVTPKEIRQLFAMFDGKCAYCDKVPDKERNLHLEHITALSEGGRNTLVNLIPACVSCNAGKHSKPLVTYFLDNRDKFPDDNFALVVRYISLLSNSKQEDVVKEMTEDHADYLLKQMDKDLAG